MGEFSLRKYVKLVFTALLGYSPFSCLGKKRAKRSRHRGGAVRLASYRARAALPYVPHPARTYDGSEYLNLHPEHDKNVPIFAVQWFCFWNSAGRRERSRRQRFRCCAVTVTSMKPSVVAKCAREGFTGEGVYGCGSTRQNASPVPISLATFLFGDKKVTPGYSSINYNLSHWNIKRAPRRGALIFLCGDKVSSHPLILQDNPYSCPVPMRVSCIVQM